MPGCPASDRLTKSPFSDKPEVSKCCNTLCDDRAAEFGLAFQTEPVVAWPLRISISTCARLACPTSIVFGRPTRRPFFCRALFNPDVALARIIAIAHGSRFYLLREAPKLSRFKNVLRIFQQKYRDFRGKSL
jgi:hypothetical protein